MLFPEIANRANPRSSRSDAIQEALAGSPKLGAKAIGEGNVKAVVDARQAEPFGHGESLIIQLRLWDGIDPQSKKETFGATCAQGPP